MQHEESNSWKSNSKTHLNLIAISYRCAEEMSRIEIDTPELKNISLRSIDEEPNWLSGDLKGYPDARNPTKYDRDAPLQQGDLIKPLLMDILQYGLPYAFAKFNVEDPDPTFKCSQTKKPRPHDYKW